MASFFRSFIGRKSRKNQRLHEQTRCALLQRKACDALTLCSAWQEKTKGIGMVASHCKEYDL
jgi:hypothetical protein